MSSPKLGKLREVNLRDIWPNEAADFTKWLGKKEGLDLLGEAIGIELDPVETESAVGSFSVDVLARDSVTDRPVVIENQLEDTDHDHLGKIVTYAAGKDASVVVWVVRHAREEHAKAIEWLNQHTDDTVAFFLVEVHAWRIGNSDPAAAFNVIERPNDWAKAMRDSDGLSETRLLQLDYWQAYYDRALATPEFMAKLKPQRPAARNYTDIRTGHGSVIIALLVDIRGEAIRADIYVKDDFGLMEDILSHTDELEQLTGIRPTSSSGKKDGRVRIERTGCPLADRPRWPEYISWQLETALKLKGFLDERWT